MKYTIITVALVVILGVGYYFMTNGSSEAPAYTPPTTSDTAANLIPPTSAQTTSTTTPSSPVAEIPVATPSSNMAVNIQGFAFSPATLTVKTGTKVTWTNNDTAPHTVTSDSGNLLNSPTLSPGQSFSFTFTTPSSVSYHCAIHSMMKGTIIVTK